MIHTGFIGDSEITDDTDKSVTVLFSVTEEVGALAKCLKIFEVSFCYGMILLHSI